jgi:putative NADH-flavin reductase
MFQGKVMVARATGGTGGAAINELLARGHAVRALTETKEERMYAESPLNQEINS